MKPTASRSSRPGNIFDAFVKKMFGQVLVFVDFLTNYANPHFVEEIETGKICPAPTHYLGKEGDERIADLVFQCPVKHGDGNLMAVIVFEHQGGSLKRIPRKLHKYISAIWDAEEKEGRKILSAPYFIVLRTAKKPHRGKYPRMSDSTPKDRNGKPLGNVPEIDYDVIDLPALDFQRLTGSPTLRLALGILKKMVEGKEEEFADALLPLQQIAGEERQIELTKELLQFVAKVFAAHHKRLDAATVKKSLKPIFREKEALMLTTIFDEKFLEGRVEGRVEGQAEMIIRILTHRLKTPSKILQSRIRAVSDPRKMNDLGDLAIDCVSLEEFSKALD